MYLYREGFARFTNARYSMSKADIDNPYVQKEKDLIETADDELLPITMMQSEAQEQRRKQEIAEKGAATGPQYKQKLEQMKNRRSKKE